MIFAVFKKFGKICGLKIIEEKSVASGKVEIFWEENVSLNKYLV